MDRWFKAEVQFGMGPPLRESWCLQSVYRPKERVNQ
jgi:hypothetical protein